MRSARRDFVGASPAATGGRTTMVPVTRPVGRTKHNVYAARSRDTVDVTCWCERRIVGVPIEEVRSGRTRSCGRPRCAP